MTGRRVYSGSGLPLVVVK